MNNGNHSFDELARSVSSTYAKELYRDLDKFFTLLFEPLVKAVDEMVSLKGFIKAIKNDGKELDEDFIISEYCKDFDTSIEDFINEKRKKYLHIVESVTMSIADKNNISISDIRKRSDLDLDTVLSDYFGDSFEQLHSIFDQYFGDDSFEKVCPELSDDEIEPSKMLPLILTFKSKIKKHFASCKRYVMNLLPDESIIANKIYNRMYNLLSDISYLNNRVKIKKY